MHAITDALLGSLALGDIGKHFPNTDEQFKDVDSAILLKKTYQLIKEKGYKIGNIDSVVALQEPKLAEYILQIQEKISSILEAGIDQISIKATTTEGLGFIGREEGISAFASVLIFKAE